MINESLLLSQIRDKTPKSYYQFDLHLNIDFGCGIINILRQPLEISLAVLSGISTLTS
jgi:hypothetical protein